MRRPSPLARSLPSSSLTAIAAPRSAAGSSSTTPRRARLGCDRRSSGSSSIADRGAPLAQRAQRLRRHLRARPLRALLRSADPRRRCRDRAHVDGLPRRRSASRGGEYYALVLLRARRHDHHGGGDRPDRALPRPRGDVDRRLRARRGLAHPGPLQRGGAQVLPARRLRDRLPAVRHRARLRRDRSDARSTVIAERIATRQDRTLLLRRRRRSCWSRFGFKVAAVPFHMWTPGRLRGRADGGDGAHGGRR